jgi:hypothetical protein
VSHPIAAQLDRIANASLGLRKDPPGKPLARCLRLGAEGGLAPRRGEIAPRGLERLDEDRRGVGIEWGRDPGGRNALHRMHTARLGGSNNAEGPQKFPGCVEGLQP